MAVVTGTASAGIARLTATFPLPERLAALPDDVRRTHRAVLDAYLRLGEPPPPTALDEGHVERLAAIDAVVVSEGRIVGAYPFSSDATGHAVEVGEVVVGSMCSLDALAVGPVFGVEATVHSVCAVTGAPIRLPGGAPTQGVFVGIHYRDPASCAAASLCRNMVFLADASAAEAWRSTDPVAREVYTLPEAVEFAERFFAPVVG